MKLSDNLHKGNWIRTEYGIVRVAFVIWDTVYIYGKDNRVKQLESECVSLKKISETFKISVYIKKIWNNGK